MEDKFLHYSIEKLLAEDSFLNWVRKKQPDYSKWQNWLEGNPEQLKRANEAANLLATFHFVESDSKEAEDRIWSRIDSTIGSSEFSQTETDKKLPIIKILSFTGIAASICLLLYFGLFHDPLQTLSTQNADSLVYILPDKTEIMLNANSSIKYDEKSFNDNRVLELKGEAFFKVEKGDHFKINTELGLVEVLGTSFNVISRSELFEVKVITGRVKVSSKNAAQMSILESGDELKLQSTGQFLVSDFDTIGGMTWITGLFKFEDASLQMVFEELERQFDIKVECPDEILNLRYTGSFQNSDLDSALYSICWPMKLESRKSNNKIFISKIE